ncbi:MAG: hypothetical protein ABH986_04880 [archaeon]
MPENLFLGSFESKLFFLIKENWPVTSIELAELLDENLSSRETRKRAYSKYSYYLKKLVSKKLLFSKKSGNTLVVWPLEVEKYRVIDSIISEKPLEEKNAKQLLR